MSFTDKVRLAFRLHLPAEMQQLGSQMLDMEGFCHCGRLIGRWEGKFLLAAVMPSKETTILAAYCQPCSQLINHTLAGLRHAKYVDETEAIPAKTVPRNFKDIS